MKMSRLAQQSGRHAWYLVVLILAVGLHGCGLNVRIPIGPVRVTVPLPSYSRENKVPNGWEARTKFNQIVIDSAGPICNDTQAAEVKESVERIAARLLALLKETEAKKRVARLLFSTKGEPWALRGDYKSVAKVLGDARISVIIDTKPAANVSLQSSTKKEEEIVVSTGLIDALCNVDWSKEKEGSDRPEDEDREIALKQTNVMLGFLFVIAHEAGHILFDSSQSDLLSEEEERTTEEAVGRPYSSISQGQIPMLMREFRSDLYAILISELISLKRVEEEMIRANKGDPQISPVASARPPFEAMLQAIYSDVALREGDRAHMPADLRIELLSEPYKKIAAPPKSSN